jgi:hypothetical protein
MKTSWQKAGWPGKKYIGNYFQNEIFETFHNLSTL